MFQEKSAEELKGLGAEELALYYNEYNAAKRQEMEAAIASKADASAITELQKKYDAIVESQLKSLNDALKAQGLKIEKLTKGSAVESKSVKSLLEENRSILEGIKNKSQQRLSLKVAGTMLNSTNVSGGTIPQPMREAGITAIATRAPYVAQLLQAASTDSTVIEWVEQRNKDGQAGVTGEGAKKNQIDYEVVITTQAVKKITAFIKVSKEMLTDSSFMSSEISNELIKEVELALDAQLLSGNGLGENLKGILTSATPFAVGTFANAVVNPNNWDVLKVAINQVHLAHFTPTYILMNPSDVTLMGLEKDSSTNQYILPPFQSADGMQVSGVRIIANTGVPADNFVVFDGAKGTVYTKEGVSVEVGMEGDDFTKNLVTVLAEVRALLVIKANNAGAFVKGVFSAAKIALKKV